GVPIEHVTIHHGDTAVVKQGVGTFGSRSQAVGGAALHLAGGKVKAKMAKFAAALLEANEDDLVFENGRIFVKGSPASGKSIAEVAAFAYIPVPLPAGMEPGLSEEGFFEPSNNTYPFGCHITMLEIDRDTGEPRLLRMVASDDAGNLINPMIVEGQIHGGMIEAFAMANMQFITYDKDGNCIGANYMDYLLPTAWEAPHMELFEVVTPSPHHPIGCKGIGESTCVGGPAAFVNAVIDAVEHLGVRNIDMPCLSGRVWEAIHYRKDVSGYPPLPGQD
ncbi:MAG TPA: molybdopterin cofactor-binding domain-containing protein, partial [Arenibaculum sp.]|nr:molybdopterin cofactor-binding domain-containing protein [Arenibaculum sp.]